MDLESNGGPVGEPTRDDDRSTSLASRIVGAGTGGARRVVGATGIDQAVEAATEEAIVRAIESEAVERSIARILNGPLVENAVRDALKSDAVEQAALELADSDLVDRIWAQVLKSDETQLLIERIAEAPEIRAALASQGMGLVDDIGRGISRVTRILDFGFERVARKVLFRPRRQTATDRVGIVTRLLALALDGVLVNVMMVTTTAVLGFLAAAVGVDLGDLGGAAYAVGGAAWLALGSIYLFIFWSISGQTPGMRFLDIRIEHEGKHSIGPRLATRRLIGFWLSAIPFGLGFIGVMTRLERQGFHDRLGKTAVYYINPAEPNQPHLPPVINPMEEMKDPPVGTHPDEYPAGPEKAIDSL